MHYNVDCERIKLYKLVFFKHRPKKRKFLKQRAQAMKLDGCYACIPESEEVLLSGQLKLKATLRAIGLF